MGFYLSRQWKRWGLVLFSTVMLRSKGFADTSRGTFILQMDALVGLSHTVRGGGRVGTRRCLRPRGRTPEVVLCVKKHQDRNFRGHCDLETQDLGVSCRLEAENGLISNRTSYLEICLGQLRSLQIVQAASHVG